MKRRACELYSEGLSTSKVAKELGIGQSTVTGIIKSAGISRTLSESHMIKDDEKQKMAIDMYLSGMSAEEVSKKCQVCDDTVLKWVRESGNIVRTNMKGKGALDKWRTDKS